jgi:hypothetical protein
LYIDGKRVLHGWESFSSSYWFATEKANEQMNDLGDGKPVKDTIYFGLVYGLEEELGYFFQAETESLRPKT